MRQKRKLAKPKHLENYELYVVYCLVNTAQESEEWKETIKKELESHNFKTWITVDLPENVKPIETKWVFRTKPDGTKKARLKAKGFQTDRTKLTEEFNAKDVGELQCFIGAELTIEEKRIELSQLKLIDKMLKRFNPEEYKGSASPTEDRS
ncbi:hypothetical protein PR048_005528 [Dryococelus australis]|uniref:Reverse transcriptase Ty1/copia-type domain-containing protein n=1 Tax=Dryococelus australis TaxID=614101 RepID=A0ABQ9I8F3_9NEOP|nr:hypothetical protein PR048_005528 [Dryococelus australis]